ncbi:MAG: hypothetical protein LBH77_02700, partial [Tannerella sp.]|nr:hypothetical protein [Tannerella sp.]
MIYNKCNRSHKERKPMLRISSFISGVIFFFFSFSAFVHSQTFGGLQAVDDAATTGPMQPVRIDVIANDTMPCIDSYTWYIVDDDPQYPSGTVGTVTKEGGHFIVFKPGIACRNTSVTIKYALKCSSVEDTATVVINVTNYNQPINVLPADIACWNPFPSNVGFDVQTKFHSNA